jgi:hypothetical protein
MKINNIEQLRNFMVDNLEKMSKKNIDVTEMGIIAKSGEAIMSSLKLQLTYSSMIGDIPCIKFLDDCHDGIPAPKQIANNPKQINNVK